MSPAVCETCPPSTAFVLDGLGGGGGGVRCGGGAFSATAAAAAAAAAADRWVAEQEAAIQKEAADKKDGQLDIWASIQASKKAATDGAAAAPSLYVHPLVRRSASSLSQKSLEVCTESLGSETGSDGMLSTDAMEYLSSWKMDDEEELEEKEGSELNDFEAEKATYVAAAPPQKRRKELAAVNYHCSVSRASPPRSFPPPLPSLSRRDGPCLSMRPHRRGGRLVVEAVAVPSQNYLHARRHDGRLLLTFVETAFDDIYPEREESTVEDDVYAFVSGTETEVEEEEEDEKNEDEEDEENEEEEGEDGREEEEEEVEVVDRGIVVEVKVSRPPPPQSGGVKVQRSSVVINKFVGVPTTNQNPATAATVLSAPGRSTATTTTTTTATAVVAAAAVASSSLDADDRYWRHSSGGRTSALWSPSPEKLFFTSKRTMNRQDLLHQVRRCSEHLRPLFIWEPCCIATS